jgi:hypothetical protein
MCNKVLNSRKLESIYKDNPYVLEEAVSVTVQRLVDTDLINVLPNKWISDFHLDAHAISFYNKNGKRILLAQVDTDFGVPLNIQMHIKTFSMLRA